MFETAAFVVFLYLTTIWSTKDLYNMTLRFVFAGMMFWAGIQTALYWGILINPALLP